ncbi:alpha/beta hydrolase [bacterium]|nr:alpha/beta hydrolase [bacterium]
MTTKSTQWGMKQGDNFRSFTAQSNGRMVHGLEAGEGPLVIALHGFPDLPISFRHQIPLLAENGYRVIAPCLRGYSEADSPSDGPFEVAILIQDLLALIDQLSDQPVTLLGHDWGAAVVRGTAIMAPEKVAQIVCMSVPTAGHFGRALLTNPTQQRRSWYMYFFQLPLAEMAVAHNDFEFIEQLWQEWSPGWHYPQAVMAEIKGAFRNPSVLRAALGYYRSQFNPALQQPDLADIRKRLSDPIPVPAMHLHGANDGCIGAETTTGMESAFLKHFENHIIPSAGHFLHQEQPDIVNRLVIGFLNKQLS